MTHDFGKYSDEFQNYIRSAHGLINKNSSDYIDPVKFKGKIDHSTEGAQNIWSYKDTDNQILIQMISLCLASHHSGLMDCITPEGKNKFSERMNKKIQNNLNSYDFSGKKEINTEIDNLLKNPSIFNKFYIIIQKIIDIEKNRNPISIDDE